MSADQVRRQLEQKRKQRTDAEKKAGEYRIKESNKRADADKARQAATKSKSPTTVKSKTSEANRRDNEAATAGKEANRWQTKASGYAKEERTLHTRLSQAERSEDTAAERKRRRDQQQADRRAAADRAALNTRLTRSEATMNDVVRTVRAPKPEKLRVLLLGSSTDGELRVGREQRRIRAAVESALHRDLIDLDVRPAATTGDLLDGITKFRPHIVHFSGHSNEDLIVFERDIDAPHKDGQVVMATTFARAIAATDDPPMLVLLNACNSAAQIDNLVDGGVPFAIGMSDIIADGDAIVFAAQFYASIANGQSVQSAHLAGQAALELAGLDGAELPTLAAAAGLDPAQALLVHVAP